MTDSNRKNCTRIIGLIAVLAALFLLLAPVGSVAAANDSISNPTETIPDDQLFEGTDDGQVVVWERSFLPLRSDDTDASTQVSLPDTLNIQQLGSNENFTDGDDGEGGRDLLTKFDGDTNPAGIHNPGEITLAYDAEDEDTSAINGESNVDFIAARYTGSEEGFPADYSEAVNLFKDVESANANATFEFISENATINDKTELTHNFDQPGQYIIVASANNGTENGYEISNGEIEAINGTVALVGLDLVNVHKSQVGVTPPTNATAGENLSFQIDASDSFTNSQDGEMTHVVAMYKQDTFESSRFELVVDRDELGPEFDLNEDSQIEHSIRDVDGVIDVEDGIVINGADLYDGRVTRSVELGGIIDRLGEDLRTTTPVTDPIEPSETINASVVGVTDGDRQANVTVETEGEFKTGTYQYVVITKPTGDASSISTRSGIIDLSSQQSGQPGGESLEINSVEINDTEITPQEPVGLSVAVENPTNSTIQDTLRLTTSDGEEFDTQDVDVNPGETAIAQLETSFDSTGTRNLNVTGDQTITYSVAPIEVIPEVERSFDVSSTSVEVDETVNVDVTVTNNRRTEQTIPIEVTGDTPNGIDTTRNIVVDGESTKIETISFSYDSAGEYSISVDGVSRSDTVTVSKKVVFLDATVVPSEVSLGEDVTVSATRSDTNKEINNASLEIINSTSGETVYENADQSLPYTTTFESGEYEANITKSSDRIDFKSSTADFTILEPADLSLTKASTAFSQVTASQNIEASATIENTGEIEGTNTIRLVANDTESVIAKRNVDVSGDGSRSVVLSGTLQPSGDTLPQDRPLEIQRRSGGETRNTIPIGEVSILSAVRVSVIEPQKETVSIEDTVDINVTVRNQGTEALTEPFKTQNVTLNLDGDSISKEFSPDAGETASKTYTFGGPFDSTGSKDLTGSQKFVEEPISEPALINVTSREVYDVELTANTTEFEDGETVALEVTSPGDPLNLDEPSSELEATVDVRDSEGEIVTSAQTTDGTVTIPSSELSGPGVYRLRTSDHSATNDERIADPGRVQLNVLEPGDIRIVGTAINTLDVVRTESARVGITVANPGETPATETISLEGRSNDGASQTLTLDGGDRRSIILSTSYENTGSKSITITTDDPAADPVSAGTIQVDSILSVTDISVSPTRYPDVGESVSIDVDVTNEGTISVDDSDLERNITLDIGTFSSDIESEQITRSVFTDDQEYAAGETNTITFEPDTLNPTTAPGRRTVAVDNEDGGEISVSRDFVGLSLSVSGTETTGEPITFNVTREDTDTRVDANIRLPDRTLQTGEDGSVTTTFSDPVSGSVTATKTSNETEYYGDDSEFLSVTEPAEIEVVSSSLNTTTAFAGEAVAAEVVLTNTGGAQGSRTINLTQADSNTILANQTVTLDRGEQRTIELETELDETGDSTLAVEGETAGTVIVADALAVTDTDVPSAVEPGEFTVDVTVTDRVSDGEQASREVSISVGDNEIGPKTITPPDGESTTESFEFDITEEGSYSVTRNTDQIANPVSVGDVTVSQNTVGLDLTVSSSEVKIGEEITFDVTKGAADSPADASVEVAGRVVSTGDDGSVTTTVSRAGNYTAVATKEANLTTAFRKDSAQINVSDSISVAFEDTENFGDVAATPDQSSTQTRTVTINNTGGRSVAISQFGFTGVDADQYAIASNTPSSVDANSKETIDIEFAPTVRSNTDATLQFRTDTPETPVRTLSLNGTGLGSDIDVNTTAIGFGSNLNESDLPVTRTINVTNEGNEQLSVSPDDQEVGDAFSVPSDKTIPVGGSQQLTIEFDPDGELGQFGDVLPLTTNDDFDESISVSLTGTVSQSELSVSSTDIDVGELPVDNSTSTNIVVRNTGTEPISGINTLNQTESNGLEITSPSESRPVIENLRPGSQELLTIELAQTENASQSEASLKLIPSGEANNQTVSITADVTAPTLSLTPAIDADPNTIEQDFEELSVGSRTTSQFVLENTGDAPLRVSDIQITGENTTPFRTNTRSLTIPAAEERSISVGFAPQTTGDKTANLEFEWNNASTDGTTTVTADLSGQGTETALSGDQSSVSFGTTGVGSSVEKQLQITNDGNVNLTNFDTTISSLNQQFSVNSSTVPSELAADESATIAVEYTPTEADTHTTSLKITGSSVNGFSSFTTTLEGEATPPEARVTDSSLSFGYVDAARSETAYATTQIENNGRPTTSLDITSVSIIDGSESFTVANSPAGTTLNGSESMTANVSYAPESDARGTQEGILEIETNDPAESPITVSLSGVATGPDASLNRSSISFGEVPTDTTSSSEAIEIRNNGGAPLTVTDTSLDSTDHFTLDSGFNGTLVAGDTATISASASPTSTGFQSTNLTLTTETLGTRTIELETNGIEPEAQITTDIDGNFGSVGISSSATQTLTIENDGAAPLTLDNISASGEAYIVLGSQQTVRLADGENTEITVAFSPTAQDETFNENLSIDTNDEETPTITRTLTGTGALSNATVSSSTVEFGSVGVDTTAENEITLTNDGESPLVVTGVTIEGSDTSAFDVSGLGTPNLSAGESQSFNVSVSPTTAQSLSGQLQISTDTSSNDVGISLGAVGTQPELEVASNSITFDNTRIGESTRESLEVRNTGNIPLDVRDVLLAASTDQFSVGTDSTVVPAKDSRTLAVRFTPNDNVTAAKQGDAQTATLTIRSNDTDTRTQSIDLTAQSKTPDLQVDNILRYGTLEQGVTTTRQVEVSNAPTASADITIDEITLIGSDASEFSVTPPSDRTLDPSDTQTVDVSVTPETADTKTASVLLSTNDPRESLATVSLSNSRTIVVVRYGSVTFDYNGVETTDPKFKASNDPTTGVVGLDPSLNTVTDFNMTFSTQSAGSAQGSGIASSRPVAPIRYLDISTDGFDPSQHNQSTVQFRVSKSTLDSLDVGEDGISLYQYNDSNSEYKSLSTTRVPDRDNRTAYAYSATFDTLDDLAVGAGQPSLGVSSVTASNVPQELDDTESANITIDATITNDGSVAGTDRFSVVDSDGTTTLNSTTATVEANSNTQITLDIPVTGPGTRRLSVEGAGTSQDVNFNIDDPDADDDEEEEEEDETPPEQEEEEDDDSGQGGAGGQPGGQEDEQQEDEQQEDEQQEDQTPTVEQVRELLDETDPATETSTEISDANPDKAGVNVQPEGTESVEEITLNNEEASGSIDIREWSEPPEEVAQSVAGEIQNNEEVSEEVADEVDVDEEATADETELTAEVTTVADIDPTSEEVAGSSATVSMTASREDLEDPEDAVMVHETENGWEVLETTIEDRGEDEVALSGDVESFSLFAIAEVETTQTEGTDEGPAEADEGSTDSDDGGSQTGLIIVGLIALVAVAGAAIYARNNDML